ncbi:MAG: ABC transporter permease, partial [Puniceicoccales bacterium]|nr:ABC transporter permease [Puniceicoccales bacterium]
IQQYGRYLIHLMHGDLGPSYKYAGWDVMELIKQKIMVSAELGGYALLVALVLGLVLGSLSAFHPHSWVDTGCMGLAMFGLCLPTFVMGPFFAYLFAYQLHWVACTGWEDWNQKILPALTLGLVYAAYIARLTRNGLSQVLQKDYIRAARARGLSEGRIFLFHALRNGIQSVIAFLGPTVAGLITGSFVVETVFQVPGLGRLFVQSITNRDTTLILGITILYAICVITLNFASDLILAYLNPRHRDA